MVERLVIVVVAAIVGALLYRWYCQQQLRKAAHQAQSDPILNGWQLDIPTIVYFTTPGCVPCKTQQQPALERLREQINVQVIQINAADDPEAAKRWGVMTAPTTFVLGAGGQPQAVNYGVADERLLLKQLQAVH